jgi:hypothetical protein
VEGLAMKYRIAFAMMAVTSVIAVFMSVPALVHGQQAPQAQQHEEHHPGNPPATATPSTPDGNMMGMMARMKASDAKLDGLVKKMNAASGPAKVDAIAELLTALVDERRMSMEPMMSNMMNMMGGRGGHSDTAPTNPQK